MNANHALIAHIKNIIQQTGPISFAEYMQLVLNTPELGYYAGNLQKIGAQGDFITAPEIGPRFAYCLANQIQEISEWIKNPAILEIGAGSGQLALDTLTRLQELDRMPSHYYIYEPSDYFRQLQTEKLQELSKQVSIQWLDQLEGSANIIIANEVLDVLPVHCFEWHPQQVFERVVDFQDGFVWKKQPADSKLTAAVNNLNLSSAPAGYRSEINLALDYWIKKVANCCQQGVIMLIDYGFPAHEYYHPDRNEGTLMCHYRHQANPDPFYRPGQQDITSHVDFSQVCQAALNCDLMPLGFCHQAGFLLDNNLLEFCSHEPTHSEKQEILTLTSPAEMGELFKVLALGKHFDEPLSGFQRFDRLHSLFAEHSFI